MAGWQAADAQLDARCGFLTVWEITTPKMGRNEVLPIFARRFSVRFESNQAQVFITPITTL